MTKAIGIVGTLGRVGRVSFMDTPQALNEVGGNTGNLFFQYAVSESIASEKVAIGPDLPWDPAVARERLRVVVVPAANFVREEFDLTGFVDYLEKTELPLVVVGLGVQADNFDKSHFNLHPSIERLISLFSERCTTVGVRGAYTAAVLDDLGLRNTKVIGCPSNFVNRDPLFVEKLKSKWDRGSELVSATGDEPWPKDVKKRDVERRLIEIVQEHGGVYVAQSVEPIVALIRGGNPYQTSLVSDTRVDALREALCPDMTVLEFRRFVSSYARLYFDTNQWLEDMSRFDLSLGLRLHGNMIAHQAGCPSIWIHHDARTQELCDAMDLPCISIQKFLDKNSVPEIKAAASVDYEKYGVTRNILRERYKQILTASSIDVVF